jgi:hypothetical protein
MLRDDESMNTINNLKVVRALDIDKLMLMEKENIIKYYESIIDKCHDVIMAKRDSNRSLKQQHLTLEYHLNTTIRSNSELQQQNELLKKYFSGRLTIIQNDRDNF